MVVVVPSSSSSSSSSSSRVNIVEDTTSRGDGIHSRANKTLAGLGIPRQRTANLKGEKLDKEKVLPSITRSKMEGQQYGVLLFSQGDT